MKKLISITLLVLLMASSFGHVSAQNLNSNNLTQWIRMSYDSEKITVAAVAIGFTSSLINPTCTDCPGTGRASSAVCTLETAEIRVSTVLADAPTTVTGMLVPAGSSIAVYGYNDIAAFRAIRTTGTSGVLNCTYYR